MGPVKNEVLSPEHETHCVSSAVRRVCDTQKNASDSGSLTNKVKSELHYTEYENSYISSSGRTDEPTQNNVYVNGMEFIRVKTEPQDTNCETNHVSSTEEAINVLMNHAYENAVAEKYKGEKQLCRVEVQTVRMECREMETQTILTYGDLSHFSDEDLKNEMQLRKLLRKRALENSKSHTESSPSKMQKRGPGRPRKDQSKAPKSDTPAEDVANISVQQDKKLLPTEKQKRGPGRPRKEQGEAQETIQPAADVASIHLQQDEEASSKSIVTETNVAHTGGADISVPVPGVAGERNNKPKEGLSGSTDADSALESAVHKPDDTEDVSDIIKLSDIPVIRRKYKKIDMKEKKKIVEEAKLNGVRSTAAKYHIGKSTVGDWMKVDFSSSVKRTKKGSLIGNSRPLTYSPQKEVMILSWILSMREQRQYVTLKMLQNYATSVIQEENPNFRGSRGWASLFFKRHGLVLRGRRSQSQKLPEKLKEKIHREFSPSEKMQRGPGLPRTNQSQAPKISQLAADVANIPLQQDKEACSNNIVTATNVAHTSGAVIPVPVPGVAGETGNNSSKEDWSWSTDSDSASESVVQTHVVHESDDTEDVRDVIQLPDIPVIRGKYRKMDMEEKFRIVEEAKLHGVRPTATKYHLTPSTVGTWMKIDFSKTVKRTKKGSLVGSGRPLTYSPQKEVMILSWILSMREQRQYVTLKMLQNYATSVIQEENPSFQGTTGWASWFLKRHGLALRGTRSKTQKLY